MRHISWVILAAWISIVACASTPTRTPTQVGRATRGFASTPQAVRIIVAPESVGVPVDTPAPAQVRAATPPLTQVVWRGDLHMHTVCSDGANTYDEMVQRALELHLDFIAITDHVGISERECHNEALIKCAAETRLVCFPGAELTDRLHMLAIGIHQRIDPHLPLKSWVEQTHRQKGLAIAAHPYDKRWKYSDEELYHSGLDAMECARGTAEENQLQWQLSDKYNLPCVYNSDAHYQRDVGWRYNVCSVPIHSVADLEAALIGHKCTSSDRAAYREPK
jgi:predicted metal-dependent phosphoesterase TrpH